MINHKRNHKRIYTPYGTSFCGGHDSSKDSSHDEKRSQQCRESMQERFKSCLVICFLSNRNLEFLCLDDKKRQNKNCEQNTGNIPSKKKGANGDTCQSSIHDKW